MFVGGCHVGSVVVDLVIGWDVVRGGDHGGVRRFGGEDHRVRFHGLEQGEECRQVGTEVDDGASLCLLDGELNTPLVDVGEVGFVRERWTSVRRRVGVGGSVVVADITCRWRKGSLSRQRQA